MDVLYLIFRHPLAKFKANYKLKIRFLLLGIASVKMMGQFLKLATKEDVTVVQFLLELINNVVVKVTQVTPDVLQVFIVLKSINIIVNAKMMARYQVLVITEDAMVVQI